MTAFEFNFDGDLESKKSQNEPESELEETDLEEPDTKPKRKKSSNPKINVEKHIDAIELTTAHLSDRLKNLEDQLNQPTPSPKLKSPNDLYFELLKQYSLPISITYEELFKIQIPNADHKIYLIRYKKNKSDFDLFFGLQ